MTKLRVLLFFVTVRITGSFLARSIFSLCFLNDLDPRLVPAFVVYNKTKDWALVQNAALVGDEVSLG